MESRSGGQGIPGTEGKWSRGRGRGWDVERCMQGTGAPHGASDTKFTLMSGETCTGGTILFLTFAPEAQLSRGERTEVRVSGVCACAIAEYGAGRLPLLATVSVASRSVMTSQRKQARTKTGRRCHAGER